MIKQLKKKLLHTLSLQNPNVQMPSSLFLIVGCYNSGTTLLNHILSKHSEISALSTEGVTLTKEFRTPEEFGWNRLWYKCREQLEICRLEQKPDVTKVRLDWANHFDATKPYALEKSIIHGLNIDWFEENFEHPYFIWIIRNGYTVAEGIRRRTLHKPRNGFTPGEPYPIEWCAEQWVQSNKVIEQKLQQVRHSYFLRYEDLVDNPDITVQSLLGWLPVEAKQLDIPGSFAFQKQIKPVSNQNEESLQRIASFEFDKINHVAHNHLCKYNYEIL